MPPFYVFQRFNLVTVEPMSATSSLSGVAGFRRCLAVLVAINRYENGITSLRTPEAKAEKLAFVLNRDHGFETEIIVDEQATLPRLEAFLTAMQNRIGINGIALDGDSGPEGYLLLQDATWESTELYRPMAALNKMLSGHWGAVFGLAFAPDGKTLASGGRDGVIRLWNTAA